MAKRSFKTRRKIVKTKKGLPKILIAGMVAGGGYLLWKNILKPYLDSQKDKNSFTDTSTTTDQAIQQVVQTASTTTPNVTSTKVEFSPIGTAYANLKWDTPITYGSKGEEIKRLQNIFNNLHNLYTFYNWIPKYSKITADGIYGQKTWAIQKLIDPKAKSLRWWLDYYDGQENMLIANKLFSGNNSVTKKSDLQTAGQSFNFSNINVGN
jgi:hypothetical protein